MLYYYKDFVESTLPLLMIEDTLDMLTIDDTPKYALLIPYIYYVLNWIVHIRIFDYIEKRTDRLFQGLEPGKGKGLVVLRFCNELLRRLSRTKNSAFCGRVLLFLTSAYPLAERSGNNLRGDFNIDNVTYFEPEPEPEAVVHLTDSGSEEAEKNR